MRLSIRWKFILSIGITLLVTYVSLLAWDYWWQRQVTTQQMQQIVSELAQSRANTLNERFSSIEVMTAAVAGVFERNPPTSAAQLEATWMRAHPPLQPNVNLFIVFDQQVAAAAGLQPAYRVQSGNIGRAAVGELMRGLMDARREQVAQRGATGQPRGGDRGGRGRSGPLGLVPDLTPMRSFDPNEPLYARAAEERKPVWCDPHRVPGQPGLRATYSVPIISADKLIGVVAAVANTNMARPDVGSTGRGRGPGGPPSQMPGETPPDRPPPGEPPPPEPGPFPEQPTALMPTGAVREFTIIGGSGRVISSPTTQPTSAPSIIDWARSNGLGDLADDLQASLDGQSSAVHVHRVHDVPGLIPDATAGENYWVAFAPISSTDWIVTAAISEPHYMDPIIARLRDRAVFLVGGLLILLGVTTIVSIRVSRPIEHLASAVNQLAAGNLDAQVAGVKSRDELGQLAAAFNTMTRQLKSHVAALTKETAARETVEAEMRIARQIQTDLLPKTFPPFPDHTEFELHAVNVAAKRVAGDYYDFFFSGADQLTIVIADVSGKGMPAALLMAVTRTIIRNLAKEGLSPVQIAERANEMLVQDLSDSMFVTLFLCQYQPSTGKLVYVNAGHPLPYRFGADGAPKQFGEVTAALLGVKPASESWPIAQSQDQLRVGETLLIYTDGVTEARSPSGEMLRDEGLEQLILRYGKEGVSQICSRVVDELNRFQNGQPADDVTLVALRRLS